MPVAQSRAALPPGFEALAEDALDFAAVQVRRLITTQPGAFPIYTVGGRWDVEAEAWTNWCEGFLGGQLWLLAQHTGDSWFREQAEDTASLSSTARTTATSTTWASCSGRPGGGGTRQTGDPTQQRRRRARRPHPGHALQREGPLPAQLPGRGQPVHRHHDERRRSSSTARSRPAMPTWPGSRSSTA